jgi:hypothetical protein
MRQDDLKEDEIINDFLSVRQPSLLTAQSVRHDKENDSPLAETIGTKLLKVCKEAKSQLDLLKQREKQCGRNPAR